MINLKVFLGIHIVFDIVRKEFNKLKVSEKFRRKKIEFKFDQFRKYLLKHICVAIVTIYL